ncbi:MAG: acetylornithine transaminase [Actinomycetota bacterium]|nr:acetylornithine transaminase [Actinomycetota bacterium]
MTDAAWAGRWQRRLMANYGTPPVLLVRGQGSRVWDDEGREYVDLLAGIAVNSLGHADPRLVAAVTAQLSTLGHTSNLAATLPAIELAERLVALAGWDDGRAFFCNSGAEANEAAFKLARLTGRTGMVVASGSFHGRTMGALALTAQPAKQEPFRPLPGEVTVVEFGDAQALHAAVTDATAAVVLEPIQGESGVVVPPDGYLAAARVAADAAGALLILDEVQTGVGRTGAWFAHASEGIVPDVMTLAKGLGGGLPIGAVLARGRAAALFRPGSHGSTFGGNPVSCAAALAVLDALEQDGLLERATRLHAVLAGALVDRSSGLVDHVRGRGLLIAAVLRVPVAAALEAAARDHGLIVNAVAPNAIRLAPALTISDVDIADAMDRWESASAEVSATALDPQASR